jgi:thiamine biosynthesis protein ThiI
VIPAPQTAQVQDRTPRQDEPCVLLKLGEIVLKGRNRQQFERMLQGNIRAALRDTGIPVDIRQREGVILLRVADGEQRGPAGWTAAASEIAERVRDVPGIVTVAQPLRVAKTPEAVTAAAVALTSEHEWHVRVRARRRDKRFPLTSAQLACWSAARSRRRTGWPSTCLARTPKVFIEVDSDEVFVFTEGLSGQGGCRSG